jgi:hypothetical protein
VQRRNVHNFSNVNSSQPLEQLWRASAFVRIVLLYCAMVWTS